ncbi:MAG: hypothetical protein CH104c_0581 [Candidatus Woesebacteria bacterium]|jgi:hypothetical protein|nr:MAG: hypothetical protein CH104c_0581 [Candidatus Woesebacteria bacterium]
METAQKVLTFVAISLTVLFLIVGIQVFLVISDLRQAIKRLNSILEDAILGGGLIKPEKLTGVIEMIKRGKKMESHGENNL